MSRRGSFGPGLLVTAAFIGPGTITTASTAGAEFGYVLAWALVFSLFATCVLQEQAVRLGLATRRGLAEAIRDYFPPGAARYGVVFLVVAAIGLGNAAYQAGNIAGAALGASAIVPGFQAVWCLGLGALAAVLLLSGHYKLIEGALIGLVLGMSGIFAWAAVAVGIDYRALLAALLTPRLPADASLLVLALVGTTVVPYNLFLHASAAQAKWPADDAPGTALRAARLDTGIAVGLGGLITLAILSTAAAAFFATGLTLDAGSLATQLEPVLGPSAQWVLGIGLLASGLTSAITAPLAAAFAVCGALGWQATISSLQFRLVALTVLTVGTLFAALGTRPLAAIVFAQAANGLLLPLIAVFLLLVMNNRRLLGDACNGPLANILGGFVVLVAVGLGLTKLASVFGLL